MGDQHVKCAAHDAGEHPEHHQRKADHADGAVKKLAVKPQLALEGDRDGEQHDQRDPDRQHIARKPADDSRPRAQDHAAQHIDQHQRRQRKEAVAHGLGQHAAHPDRARQRAIAVHTWPCSGGSEHRKEHARDDRQGQRRHHCEKGDIQTAQGACPCQWFHASGLPHEMRMRGFRMT